MKQVYINFGKDCLFVNDMKIVHRISTYRNVCKVQLKRNDQIYSSLTSTIGTERRNILLKPKIGMHFGR